MREDMIYQYIILMLEYMKVWAQHIYKILVILSTKVYEVINKKEQKMIAYIFTVQEYINELTIC